VFGIKDAPDHQLETLMDDARLSNGMTLDDIGQRLVAIDEKVTSLQDEVRSGFKRVDDELTAAKIRAEEAHRELNAAKIRDEEAHRLLTFSLEAREGLRESVEARFEEADSKHDDQIDLLKQVVQHLATQQADT
jgi:hypothetical protein